MATRLSSIAIDCNDPRSLGTWWSETLGWVEVAPPDPRDFQIADPDADAWTPTLLFLPSTDPKLTKNRVHLDLASRDFDDRDAFTASLIARGATSCDIGQSDVPWIVLADPEGNEFCVLDPRDRYQTGGRLASIVIDSVDLQRQTELWEQISGWTICYRSQHTLSLHSPSDRLPDIDFVSNREPKAAKLRVHIDVEPLDGSSVEAEAERLRALGARDIDIGQHDDSDIDWIVLVDPFGYEFCVVPAM